MGSFHAASWAKVQATLPAVIVGSAFLYLFGWRLNIMTHNEEEALSLGVDVFRWRLFYLGTSTLIVASSVAAVGNISWIGLIAEPETGPFYQPLGFSPMIGHVPMLYRGDS